MPFTHRNLKDDLEDVGSNFDGAADLDDEVLVFGAPNLGENPRGDVEGQRDWWAG